MSCMGFACFCEWVVSGVVACKEGVKCRFVSFLRMFWIEKATGSRAGQALLNTRAKYSDFYSTSGLSMLGKASITLPTFGVESGRSHILFYLNSWID